MKEIKFETGNQIKTCDISQCDQDIDKRRLLMHYNHKILAKMLIGSIPQLIIHTFVLLWAQLIIDYKRTAKMVVILN